MTTEFWISLPVKNLERSKEFFAKMGFKFNEQMGNSDHSACLLMGDKGVILMLFAEEVFKTFTKNDLPGSDTTEVMISLSANSREEVDKITQRAADLGGTVFGPPSEVQGWMYGSGFADLDGHRWNILFMDFSKLK